ncbi:MAG TPA: GAF domain-containing protein [Pyrinomonadaceae bacterium]|jgi:PAS domain S-box-containing protein
MPDQARIPLQQELSSDESRGELRHFAETSRIIAETASDAILTIDQDSTILFVNRAAEKIFGYSKDEMLGQQLTMLMPDYLRQVHKAGIKQYVETGKRHIDWEAVALPGLHKSGKEIPLELSFGEFIKDGKRFFTGIARDVAERKLSERRLATQYQVTRILAEATSLVEAAPRLLQAVCECLDWGLGILWRVDRDHLRYVQSWHQPVSNFEEFEADSLQRTFLRGIGLPGRIWAGGEPIWFEKVVQDANFPRAPFAARAGIQSAFGFPLKLGNEILGIIEFFSSHEQEPDRALLDMMSTIGSQIGQFIERKRVEDERSLTLEREQNARKAAEAAAERIRSLQLVTDATLAHFALDELLAELLNRVRDALPVDTVAILLLESEGDELVASAAKGLEEEVEQGVRIPVGKGFAGRIAETAQPVFIEDTEKAELHNPLLREKGIRSLLGVPLMVEGRVIGVIHVGSFFQHQFTEDETRLLQMVADRIALAIDNARLYEEERQARKEAEAANRAKDEFLTTLSHELRTPLTPIIGWIHMMLRGVLPEEEFTRGLSVIERNSQALKRLINDLLDVSAILSGKMRIEEVPVQLEAVVREAVETVRPLAAERDVHLEVSFRDWQNPIMVNGDRTRLVQTFWNLLTNAIRFSAPGGKVHLQCESSPTEAVVQVEDNGEGIAPDFLPYVFERFRQADGSKTRTHGGLGLGLALVKSFVEAHGGSATAASDGPGLGSRFTVRLPRLAVAEAPPTIDDPVKAAAGPGAANILIVEDEPDTLEMLHAAMAARGYRTTLCASATSAMEAAAEQEFDLIISDIGMPEMDGYELIRRLRRNSRYRHTPAIAVSGYASQKEAEAAISAGFNVHLAKPFGPEELNALVEKLLKQKSDDNKIDSM